MAARGHKEKEDGIEGTVLGRSRHVVMGSQRGENVADLRRSHILGMLCIMQQPQTFDPTDLRCFCAQTPMLQA